MIVATAVSAIEVPPVRRDNACATRIVSSNAAAPSQSPDFGGFLSANFGEFLDSPAPARHKNAARGIGPWADPLVLRFSCLSN
jgi:hypothetical protein